MTEEDIRLAERELQKLDPVLGKLIEFQTLEPRSPRRDYFSALCRSIVGQQVSVVAAATIYARLEKLTGMEPKAVVALREKQVKEIGLSRQKASYIKDLAAHFVKDSEVYNHLGQLSDDEVIVELTAVKGVGVWTAQMFLMFTLARPDVFAPDDTGLQRAIVNLYGLKTPGKEMFIKISGKWRPYRTVACYHLWQSLHNEPV